MHKFEAFLSSIDGITDIELTDEKFFYEFLLNSETLNTRAFENNFAYILQSCRPFFKKFYYKSTLVFFTFHKSLEEKTRMVITNSVGPNRLEAASELAKIARKYGIMTLIKNVSISDGIFWKSQGFRVSDISWNHFSKYDDNTFPQYNFSRDTILNLKFNRDYRRLFNKYDTLKAQTDNYLASIHKDKAENFLNANSLFLADKKIDTPEEVIAAHKFFFDEEIQRKLILVHSMDNNIIGFSYLTIVQETGTGFYNAVFNEKNSNIMKYILFSGMRYTFLNFPNINQIGLQGSENKGQDFMKSRFNPTTVIEKFHYIN
jgi:hypothetical protein